MVNRACRQSSHDFSRHHGPPMNGQRRGEPWTAELSNDIEDASLISRLPNETAQVCGVKLAVATWRSLDLIVQLLRSGIGRSLRRRRCLWSAHCAK